VHQRNVERVQQYVWAKRFSDVLAKVHLLHDEFELCAGQFSNVRLYRFSNSKLSLFRQVGQALDETAICTIRTKTLSRVDTHCGKLFHDPLYETDFLSLGRRPDILLR